MSDRLTMNLSGLPRQKNIICKHKVDFFIGRGVGYHNAIFSSSCAKLLNFK